VDTEFSHITSVSFWASSCLISSADATGNSRATLPVVAPSELCEVGGPNLPVVVQAWDGPKILMKVTLR